MKKISTPTPPTARTKPKKTARFGTNAPSSPPRIVRNTIRLYVKMPAKIPSTTCVARLLMKFRRMREVYWLEAIASATRVIENVTPTTDIMEPAMVESIPRPPAAPAPNRRGHLASNLSPTKRSTSIRAMASTMLPATINEGRNHRLERRSLQSCLNLFMNRVIRMVGKIVSALNLRLRGAQADSEHPNAA